MPLQLGDRNESVRQWRIVMNVRFGGLYTRLHGPLPTNTNEFGPRAKAWQEEYERRTYQAVDGVVSDNDLRALKVQVPSLKPLWISVEGHMSDMWIGPAVETGRVLEAEGHVQLQPTGYNNTALPFDNESGVNAVVAHFQNPLLMPPGRKWCISGFSQGDIVVALFMLRNVLPSNGMFHNRLPDLICMLEYGPPTRPENMIAPWVPDPPKADTKGIFSTRMPADDLGGRITWVGRHGDLYTENPRGGVGEKETAVCDIVANSDPKAIFFELLAAGLNPTGEILEIIQAVMGGVMFLGNMDKHGGYDLGPCIDWARGKVLAATTT